MTITRGEARGEGGRRFGYFLGQAKLTCRRVSTVSVLMRRANRGVKTSLCPHLDWACRHTESITKQPAPSSSTKKGSGGVTRGERVFTKHEEEALGEGGGWDKHRKRVGGGGAGTRQGRRNYQKMHLRVQGRGGGIADTRNRQSHALFHTDHPSSRTNVRSTPPPPPYATRQERSPPPLPPPASRLLESTRPR